MTETAAAPVAAKKSRVKIFLALLPLLLLLLAYGAGIIVFPVTILKNYQAKDCEAALAWHRTYTNLYPTFIEDQGLAPQVRECGAYIRASSAEENESWSEAYDAYQAYLTAYPTGLYTKEAHKRSAVVLMGLVEDQIEQARFEEALKNLTLITLSYSDTDTNDTAWGLFPSLYTTWGSGLREANRFEEAERVFIDFKTWSQRNLRPESETEANKALAQTYLAWGQNFQARSGFEEALTKFDLAAAVDPQSQFDSAAQVQAGQRKAYVAWGNDLLEEKDFATAIQKFELAVAHSQGKDQDGVGEALVHGHIQWAAALRASNDFVGALDRLKLAGEAAQTDGAKQSLQAAFDETYLAFSQSDGKQAQQAMKDALKAVCEKKEAPGLPIFGLNKKLAHTAIYGADVQVPESLAAKTPGEMHYIACITTDNQTIDSRRHLQILYQTWRGYYYTIVQQFRVRVVWKLRLVKIDTLKSVAEQTFAGGPPPPFSNEGGDYFYGVPPSNDEISQWLQSVIE